MTDTYGAENRTEQATPRRLEKAREEGQVVRAHAVAGAAVLIAGAGIVSLAGAKLIALLEGSLRAGLSPEPAAIWESGRLLAAAGRAGVAFDPAQVLITIGGLPVFEYGVRAVAFDEAATHAAMSEREYTIVIHLGRGAGRARFVTCDLTHEYVSINADYST